MPLYEFVFDKESNNAEENQTWTIQAHAMGREIASNIVRSICKPEEFTSVHFTVYEITHTHCGSDTRAGNYTIYIPDGEIQEHKSKRLFSMTAWGIEDMLEIFSNDNFATDPNLMADLLTSLHANHLTILQAIRLYRKQQSAPKPQSQTEQID